MSIIVILNELQWTQCIRESAILRIWMTRGLFYTLIGIICMIQTETEVAAETESFNTPRQENCLIFIEYSSYLMTGFGLLYYMMGCLCMELVWNRVVADYEKRCADLIVAKKNAYPQINRA